ncbi:MAG: hypothetical protein QQN63_11785, partial [Nitrosopumilus sp.]
MSEKRKSFWSELKKRNIFRVAIAYLVVGWVIIQVGEATFESLQLPSWALTAVIVFLIIGFPIALILAWAFELSPKGMIRTSSADAKENPYSDQRKLKKSSTNHEFNSSRESEKIKDEVSDPLERNILEKSIAVLPFVNMSSDPEQEFFCEGISEEIINTIVQLPDLRVVGRTSSFCFKGKNEDLRSVGSTLGVSKILEGSVRKSGNRVRITAQLVEASTGFHLWSKKYDRELDDVFKIQDEISAEIASQLKITFAGTQSLPKSRQQTKNVEAYQLYNKGRSLFYQRGMSLFEALQCFRAALEIDSSYALAYSGL